MELLRQHRDRLTEEVNERTQELRENNELLRAEVKEHARAEKRIASQNTFLETIIESLPFPFYVVDAANYMIEMANSSARAKENCWDDGTCHLLTHASPTPCDTDGHVCPLKPASHRDRRAPPLRSRWRLPLL